MLYDPRMSDQVDSRIRLSEPGKLVLGHEADIFDCKFIKACVDAGHILPNLRDFRMNQPSFFEDYDPVDILMGRKKWSDLVRLSRSGTESDDEGQSDSSLLRILKEKRSARQEMRGRQIYTRQDQQAILDFIRKEKRYSSVKGRQLWVQMEAAEVCGGHRSWQSMKEHFRKQIMPQINSYQLKKSQIIRFRRAMDGDLVNDDESEEEEENEDEEHLPRDQGQKEKEMNGNANDNPNQERENEEPFTPEDERAMVNHIVQNKKYAQIKRDSLWLEMKSVGISQTPRTWNSMKQHFLEQVMPRIEKFGLNPSQIARFRRALKREWTISSDNEQTNNTDSEPASPERSNQQAKATKPLDKSKSQRVQTRRNQTFLGGQSEAESSEAETLSEGISGSKHPLMNKGVSSPQNKSPEKVKRDTRPKAKKQKLFDNKTPSFEEFENGIVQNGASRSSPVKSVATLKHSKRRSRRFQPDSVLNSSSSPDASKTSNKTHNIDNQSSVSQQGQGSLYTKDEDKKLKDFVANHGLYDKRNGRNMWIAMEKCKVLPGRTWQSMKTRYLKNIEPKYKRSELRKADPSKVDANESRVIQKQSGNFFTREEDQKIINFIVENRRFGDVGGNTLWQLMETRQVLPDRTSQSMKERFRRRILPKLHLFDIEPADRQRFQK